ncbi:MerR family transcriptional regulator [Paenibacillus farraposensis]|uniref:MerR family transcriptional regulator n=2 Tax=Paenibacillus farraposensis TaxID=2807095 RepID=A0ABW4DIN4_9BACL|nr:MerR family transcriptional regulator [Paenibacillus farraposensis]MCC3379295.1 MerR family transcriptional regulator [Paenibacillus farraposensis]
MGIEVNYLTLGAVAKRLDVAATTLRDWANNLEDNGVHYLERSNRGERMFDENDIAIFQFMKQYKDGYGSRRVTTTDMAYFIRDHEEIGLLCRKSDKLEPSGRHPNFTEVDIQNLMVSDRFLQLMEKLVTESQLKLVSDTEKRLEESERKMAEGITLQVEERVKEILEKQEEKTNELLEKRMNQVDEWIASNRELTKAIQEERNKGFFKRLFGR